MVRWRAVVGSAGGWVCLHVLNVLFWIVKSVVVDDEAKQNGKTDDVTNGGKFCKPLLRITES